MTFLVEDKPTTDMGGYLRRDDRDDFKARGGKRGQDERSAGVHQDESMGSRFSQRLCSTSTAEAHEWEMGGCEQR